jgi:two-component system, NtrC family, sensor kinase
MDFRLYILVGKSQGKSFKLEPDKEYTVGRHSENDINIDDKNISRHHFKIQVKGEKYFVTDMVSKNGTFVEGKGLKPLIETEVKEGVPIVIGMTILGFGEMSQSALRPFLDSAGFSSETDEYGEFIKPERVMTIRKNMEFIYNMNNYLMESKDLKKIFDRLLDGIFNLFKRVDRCVIITIDDQTGEFGNIIYRSRKPVDDPKKTYNRELVERALIMDKPVMVKDSSKSEYEDDRVTESLQLMKIRSAMCVPITSRFSIRGAIYVDSLSKPNGFRKNDLALLKDVSGRAALAMDNVSLHLP